MGGEPLPERFQVVFVIKVICEPDLVLRPGFPTWIFHPDFRTGFPNRISDPDFPPGFPTWISDGPWPVTIKITRVGGASCRKRDEYS